MARGFNATLGTASTDRIQTGLTTQNTLRSYSIWVNERTDAGDAGSYFDKSNAGVQHERLINAGDGTGSVQFKRLWSGGLATWGYPKPLDRFWHNTVVTYDSSVTTPPIMYLDGVVQTVTEYGAASGTVTDNADAYWIGNRGNGDRPTDGMLAEFAAWDRILTAAEAAGIGAGKFSPLFFPRSLVEYVPMVRDSVSRKLSAPIITGTAVQPHPAIIYPHWINVVAPDRFEHTTESGLSTQPSNYKLFPKQKLREDWTRRNDDPINKLRH